MFCNCDIGFIERLMHRMSLMQVVLVYSGINLNKTISGGCLSIAFVSVLVSCCI